MNRESAKSYLASIGLVTPHNGRNIERMLSAMEVQLGSGANKNGNRFTGPRPDGLVGRIADAAGCSRNLVNRFLFAMLERFKGAYDQNDPNFSSICTEKTLDVLSPLQFLYLISRDYAEKVGK